MDVLSTLKKEGFVFSKKYGQNFITDERLLGSIVDDAGITSADTVVEIGAGAGTLTALAEEEASEQTGEQTFIGQCRGNCFGGCPVKATVHEGKLVHTEFTPYPVEAYNRLCAKGYCHPQRTYSPMRIQYPMRLVGERGSGEFERISWEEAIDEICTKWKQYQAESGDTSIIRNSGSAVSAKTNGIYNVLWSYMGGSSIQYAYDAAGNRLSITYPDGKAVTTVYDILGNLSSLTNHDGSATRYDRDAAGQGPSHFAYPC